MGLPAKWNDNNFFAKRQTLLVRNHFPFLGPAAFFQFKSDTVSICAWFLKCQFGSLLQTRKKIDFETNSIFCRVQTCLCSLQQSISKSNWFFHFLNLIFRNWKKNRDRQGVSNVTRFTHTQKNSTKLLFLGYLSHVTQQHQRGKKIQFWIVCRHRGLLICNIGHIFKNYGSMATYIRVFSSCDFRPTSEAVHTMDCLSFERSKEVFFVHIIFFFRCPLILWDRKDLTWNRRN